VIRTVSECLRSVATCSSSAGRADGTFAASPISLDGLWVDYYLRRFTRYGVVVTLLSTALAWVYVWLRYF